MTSVERSFGAAAGDGGGGAGGGSTSPGAAWFASAVVGGAVACGMVASSRCTKSGSGTVAAGSCAGRARPPLTSQVADESTGAPATGARVRRARSEEHTSELQSRENLVCRLLLERTK